MSDISERFRRFVAERKQSPEYQRIARRQGRRIWLWRLFHPRRDPRDKSCLCQGCGVRYRVDIQVPDDLWGRISHGCNLLCPVCIAGRLEGLGEFAAFRLTEIP